MLRPVQIEFEVPAGLCIPIDTEAQRVYRHAECVANPICQFRLADVENCRVLVESQVGKKSKKEYVSRRVVGIVSRIHALPPPSSENGSSFLDQAGILGKWIIDTRSENSRLLQAIRPNNAQRPSRI